MTATLRCFTLLKLVAFALILFIENLVTQGFLLYLNLSAVLIKSNSRWLSLVHMHYRYVRRILFMFNFFSDFIDVLEDTFIKTPSIKTAIFQSPLFYNWKMDERSVVCRVTALVRTVFMMGPLIPLNINPISVFSYSAKLCIKLQFTLAVYRFLFLQIIQIKRNKRSN